MGEPLISRPTLGQRIDLMALQKPAMMRQTVWIFAVLAILSAVRTVAAFAGESWSIGGLSLLTAAGSALLGFLARRAVLRIPATQRWGDELVKGKPAPEG